MSCLCTCSVVRSLLSMPNANQRRQVVPPQQLSWRVPPPILRPALTSSAWFPTSWAHSFFVLFWLFFDFVSFSSAVLVHCKLHYFVSLGSLFVFVGFSWLTFCAPHFLQERFWKVQFKKSGQNNWWFVLFNSQGSYRLKLHSCHDPNGIPPYTQGTDCWFILPPGNHGIT